MVGARLIMKWDHDLVWMPSRAPSLRADRLYLSVGDPAREKAQGR